jgi:hypothetical protein
MEGDREIPTALHGKVKDHLYPPSPLAPTKNHYFFLSALTTVGTQIHPYGRFTSTPAPYPHPLEEDLVFLISDTRSASPSEAKQRCYSYSPTLARVHRLPWWT